MSTVEYALIVVAVIAIVGVGAGLLSGAFKGLFSDLTDEMGKSVAEVSSKAEGTGGTSTGGTTTGGTTTSGATT